MIGIINKFLQKIHSFKRSEPQADYSKERQNAGDIIIGVLTEHLTVREGLLRFPKSLDLSVQAAWHALCHYEADEDIRKHDLEYANQQQELLEMIAFTFKDGKDLPRNIIDSYKPYHPETLINPEKGLKGLVSRLTRFINV